MYKFCFRNFHIDHCTSLNILSPKTKTCKLTKKDLKKKKKSVMRERRQGQHRPGTSPCLPLLVRVNPTHPLYSSNLGCRAPIRVRFSSSLFNPSPNPMTHSICEHCYCVFFKATCLCMSSCS